MSTATHADHTLLKEAMEIGHHRDDEEAINEALRKYIAMMRRRELVKMIGKVDYLPDYNYKQERNRP